MASTPKVLSAQQKAEGLNPSTPAKIVSKGDRVAADITALLRARNPLLLIVSKEEARVEGFLAEAAAAAGYTARVWDAVQGCASMDGKKADIGSQDIDAMLDAIRARAEDKNNKERGVWILRDLTPWINGPSSPLTVRRLRNLARLLPGIARERAQAIIVLSPSGTLPEELSGHATVVDWPLPDRIEIAATLDATISALPEVNEKGEAVRANAITPETREAAIDAAIGLSGEEAAACFARSLVQTKKIDPVLIANEKKRVITKSGLGIEWYDPIFGGMDAVGGLENLKDWLLARSSAYSPEARAYGLPSPKGTFLAGVSGCGKSLTAKAISTNWQVPLLKLDLNALKGKFVGESEGNLRKVFRVIEAIGRCVVWIDEIEKALAGATGGASADGGVSADALGAILTWMQERKGEAFVIATANDITGLPPELLRKGRWDELWFVDLPNADESKAVLKAALVAHGRGNVKIDLGKVVESTNMFTGSEIAALVPDALFAAFADNAREITTADLVKAAAGVSPLAKTAETKIKALRDWAVGRARAASRATAVTAEGRVRALDL
jgi:hypothetical protein